MALGGSLEFLGRVDTQVKVRGHRVEPGEVEAVLAEHPAVHVAVVVSRTDVSNETRLVAYVVPGDASGAVDATALRAFLAERLPPAMVPSWFVGLESLPLLPSGKVDRKALPAPDVDVSERQYVAPRTPTEELLCGFFSRVLGVERVGIHDGFFELGATRSSRHSSSRGCVRPSGWNSRCGSCSRRPR